MIIFEAKSSGEYRNLNAILKLLLGSVILEYLFMNLMRAILLYNIAKCLPMQVLAPALNPAYEN